MQALFQTQSGAVDLVVRLATDVFGASIGQRDRSVAGPGAIETDERPGLGVTHRYRQQERSADAGSLDRLSIQAGTKRFHIAFPIQI